MSAAKFAEALASYNTAVAVGMEERERRGGRGSGRGQFQK